MIPVGLGQMETGRRSKGQGVRAPWATLAVLPVVSRFPQGISFRLSVDTSITCITYIKTMAFAYDLCTSSYYLKSSRLFMNLL